MPEVPAQDKLEVEIMNKENVGTLTRPRHALVALVIPAVLVGCVFLGVARDAGAVEGYDLMRIITSQWVQPSVMLLVDTSGSMKYDFGGNKRDVDFQGDYHNGWWGHDWRRSRWDCQCDTWNDYDTCDSWYCDASHTESRCTHRYCDTWETRTRCTHSYCDSGHYGDAPCTHTYCASGHWGPAPCTNHNTDGVCDEWGSPPWICDSWECDAWGSPPYICDHWTCDAWEHYNVCTHRTCDAWDTYTVCDHYSCSNWTHHHDCTHEDNSRCKVWDYRLWFFNPSRMAVLKNVLGNSVDVWTGYDIPDPFPFTASWNASLPEVRWVKDKGSRTKSYGFYIRKRIRYWAYHTDPGPPAPARDAAGDPILGVTHHPPLDLVGQNEDAVDWGLITFGKELNNSYVNVMESIDPPNNSAVIASIEGHMQLRANGGLDVRDSTPTKTAIKEGGDELATLFGTAADCGQTYGSILITDGLSNIGNTGSPADREWNSCTSDAATTWNDYPPGAANDAWHLFTDSNNVGPRTWVIGVSEDVGTCELDWTAFMGRTDASSPLGDSGFDIDSDPYLDRDVDSSVGLFDDTHGNYAYFSNSADELKAAFASILAGMGAGDYTTSAPAVSGAAAIVGTMALLPSTDYPSWQGHMRAFVKQPDASTGELTWQEFWDAGDSLANNNNGLARAIYTWDPTNNNHIVRIRPANVSTLDAICNNCGIDTSVVDFITGNDGSGTARSWTLGALINTTPAVVGPPMHWAQGQIQAHGPFESQYSDRHTLVWVGSSDGMVHAFDIEDGAEVLALVPPDLLSKQVELYSEYLVDPAKHPLGQPQSPADHVYGITNSIRVADVWDSDIGDFRTVAFIAEGPGGTGIHAIDVTHCYPGRTIGGVSISADPDYDSTEPFTPLWSLSRDGDGNTTVLSSLGLTWSVPAVGVDEINGGNAEGYSKLVLAQGYEPNETNADSPYVMFIDPIDGTVERSHQLPNAGSIRVGNQAFADSVFWQTDSDTYKPDNLLDEAVQVDLNGKLSVFSGNNWRNRNTLFDLGGEHPIYYSPSVSSYPARNPSLDIYTFSTGSYYETSPSITGSSSGFRASLFLGIREIASGSINHKTIEITDIDLPNGQTIPSTGDTTFSDLAQPIAPSILLTPAQGSALTPMAFFLVYDPLGGECVGKSYIVRIDFSPQDIFDNGQTGNTEVTTYEAGEGASGGFAIAGEKIVISQSGVGANNPAHLVEIPDLTLPVGNPGSNNVRWWMELQ